MTVFSDTIAESVTGADGYGSAAVWASSATESVAGVDSYNSQGSFVVAVAEGAKFGQGLLSVAKRYNEVDAFGIGMTLSDAETIRIGRIIADAILLQPGMTGALRSSWTVSEQIYMAQALSLALPAKISDAINVHDALAVSAAVTVLQGLGIAEAPLPTLKYTWSLVEQLMVSSLLTSFFGRSISDAINVHEAPSAQLRANPTINDAINLHEALSNHFILSVTASDAVHISPLQALKLLYSGETLSDGIQITAGYITPSGNFTAWVVNTRTAAVTEYQNYAFNSFARIANDYYGASDSGLYLLAGDTDNGASIISTIRGGLAQWGGSRFSSLKAAYLAVRGGGNWVLKIILNDGTTYSYNVNARDAATTKIVTGKGIRTRYFSFQLTNAGQDFTLDSLEFVPIISERRV